MRNRILEGLLAIAATVMVLYTGRVVPHASHDIDRTIAQRNELTEIFTANTQKKCAGVTPELALEHALEPASELALHVINSFGDSAINDGLVVCKTPFGDGSKSIYLDDQNMIVVSSEAPEGRGRSPEHHISDFARREKALTELTQKWGLAVHQRDGEIVVQIRDKSAVNYKRYRQS